MLQISTLLSLFYPSQRVAPYAGASSEQVLARKFLQPPYGCLAFLIHPDESAREGTVVALDQDTVRGEQACPAEATAELFPLAF